MIAVKNISINLSTEDNKSKAILDFSPISEIVIGDVIYLSVKGAVVELTIESDTSLSAWLDWIIATYNLLPNTSATLSRDGSDLIILGDNTDDLDIEFDLGGPS